MQDNAFIYTEDQLMARLKFFIGVCLALTLTGIVFVVLYSIIFVTQPLNAMSPIDQKFFELIVPIATFLTGTLSGIMLAGTKKEDQEAMLAAQKQANENFAETKKAMTAPLKVETTPSGIMSGGIAPASRTEPSLTPSASVVPGFGGKLAPPQAPHPEI
jgi:H+/Cl- antiporter ClcA